VFIPSEKKPMMTSYTASRLVWALVLSRPAYWDVEKRTQIPVSNLVRQKRKHSLPFRVAFNHQIGRQWRMSTTGLTPFRQQFYTVLLIYREYLLGHLVGAICSTFWLDTLYVCCCCFAQRLLAHYLRLSLVGRWLYAHTKRALSDPFDFAIDQQQHKTQSKKNKIKEKSGATARRRRKLRWILRKTRQLQRTYAGQQPQK
jgi:hypothetical protein